MASDDDDFEPVGDEDDDTSIDVETITAKHRQGRLRRGWRDIERMREQREIDRLMTNDDWFDELEAH